MKFVCSSDTHGKHDYLDVPDGDIFIFTGDMSDIGKKKEIEDFNLFLSQLPHEHKLIVGGNHDILFEFSPPPMANEIKILAKN